MAATRVRRHREPLRAKVEGGVVRELKYGHPGWRMQGNMRYHWQSTVRLPRRGQSAETATLRKRKGVIRKATDQSGKPVGVFFPERRKTPDRRGRR